MHVPQQQLHAGNRWMRGRAPAAGAAGGASVAERALAEHTHAAASAEAHVRARVVARGIVGSTDRGHSKHSCHGDARPVQK